MSKATDIAKSNVDKIVDTVGSTVDKGLSVVDDLKWPWIGGLVLVGITMLKK